MTKKSFHTLSFILIPYAILIILWGAWVRISGSGDGCGVHWPLCQGDLYPSGSFYLSAQTWIEYFHRAKSGIFGILVIIQTFFAFKLFPKSSAVRTYSVGALIFTITESLLGAALVLFSFVSTDQSIGRVVVMSLHLINTFILISLLVAVWQSSKEKYNLLNLKESLKIISPSKTEFTTIFYILVVAVLGAWAALSTTLFPSDSLIDGIQKDLSANNHFVLKLRILHPLLGLSSFYLLFADFNFRTANAIKNFKTIMILQIMFGLLTLLFLSPVWMKLIHLLFADFLWIFFITMLFNRTK